MKDSGIAWIGEIPEEWQVSRVGLHYEVILGKMLCPSQITDDYSLEKYYCAANVHFDGISDEEIKEMWFSSSEKEQYAVKEGDLLVVEGGAGAGGCAIVKYLPGPMYIQNSIMIVRGKNNHINSYLGYLIQCLVKTGYIDVVCNKATIPHFTKDKLSNIPYLLSADQARIVNYLDTQCANIDAVIEKTRASIEEYKKLKQSVITQAVTKGIRPNRTMKDSGIESISDIPCDWITPKVLQCLQMPITDGPHTTPELFDDGIPFVSAEAVSTGNGHINFDHIRGYISQEFYKECCKKYIPQIDDVYMIKSGATTGRVAILDTDRVFTIWSPLAVFRADKERILPLFLFYCLQADYVQKQIENGWTYGTQQNIGMRTLEKIKLCVPPVKEQSCIITYLDEKVSAVNRLLEKKEALLSDLEKYKRAVIFEYVTGKKEVPA